MLFGGEAPLALLAARVYQYIRVTVQFRVEKVESKYNHNITFFYTMSSNTDFFELRAHRTPAVNMSGVDDNSNAR
jgi:hypothetical protein